MFKDKLVSSDEFIASITIDWVLLIMHTKPTSDEWVAFIHVESEVTGKYSFMKCFHVWMLHAITCLLLVLNQWLGKQTAYKETSVCNTSAGQWLTWSHRNKPDFSAVLSVWRLLSLGGNESMIHRHCSNSSPCVITAKANSGLGERILPLNQQIVCVFTGSMGTFSQLWKGRNLRSSSF